MNVTVTEKTDQQKVRQGLPVNLALVYLSKKKPGAKVPKRARMKIINGRGYFYELWHTYDPETKKSTQHQRYLGKSLPLGYRLIK